MTSVEPKPLREFIGFMWPADDFSDQTGVLVHAQNVTEAATQVREAYGEQFKSSLWNEEDAAKPR